MAQTETVLYFALGFALAALIALLIGRFAWHLALRLGARRMQKQVPTTLAGLHSERDRLRAEYAMLSQKLGHRLEQANMRMAEQMAEVARHRNRLVSLAEDVARRDETIAARDAEIGSQRDRIGRLEAELAEARAEASALRDEIAAKTEQLASADSLATMLASEAETSRGNLQRRIADLTALSQEIAAARDGKPAELTGPEAADRVLAEKLAELEKAATSGEPAADGAPRPARGVAQVISLAQRIRSLQKEIAR